VLVLNAYPFLDVRNPGLFAANIIGTIALVNVAGYTFYRVRGSPERRSLASIGTA
jgi:hypothetical protein